jgi:transcriptional regulator with XRE-family HTH domain
MPVEPKLAVKLELRWMREDLGLTQAELAKLAGVSQRAIAQLESPDSNPTIDTLNRVARAMGAQIDFRPSAGESVKSYGRRLRRLGPGPERARVLKALRDHLAAARTSRQLRVSRRGDACSPLIGKGPYWGATSLTSAHSSCDTKSRRLDGRP